MAVHIGQVTSEVRAVATASGPTGDAEEMTVWEKQRRIAATMARVDRDRRRVATGHGDD